MICSLSDDFILCITNCIQEAKFYQMWKVWDGCIVEWFSVLTIETMQGYSKFIFILQTSLYPFFLQLVDLLQIYIVSRSMNHTKELYTFAARFRLMILELGP